MGSPCATRPESGPVKPSSPLTALALGLDAGGTHTRWAAALADGSLCAHGQAAGLSALQLASDEGRAAMTQTLLAVAAVAGQVRVVTAGITGFDAAQLPQLCALMAGVFGVAPGDVQVMSDIELACRAAGDGCVIYAGTGSVGAFIDAAGVLQRAGGRGVVIDDAGGGHWIARQALCRIWRAEDEAPGAWAASPLARRLFERIGGADWALTRQWVYGASRGELGTLALAVAEAADQDPVALALLLQAGQELARLARVLWQRGGPRTLVLDGRVFDLHPAVEAGLRQALPAGTPMCRPAEPAQTAAARLAASRIPA